MIQNRKEYRKSFNSSGQLYVAGETLDFIGYDVSVKGILIEIVPSLLLAEIDDFEALLKENNSAEIFVKDLMLTGEADIAWAKKENGKIMLGLEFKDVMYNAEKLWRKRSSYRRVDEFTGYLISEDKRIEFLGINLSVDGMAFKLEQQDCDLKPGDVIKLQINDIEIKGVAKIVWVKNNVEEACVLGLRYLTID